MLARLLALTVVLTAAIGLGVTGPAEAAWANAGIGAGAQKAMIMPTSTAPTVTMTTGIGLARTYTLTWPKTELHVGLPVTSYRVTRTSTLGSAVLGGGSCQGTTVLGLGLPVFVPASTTAAVQTCTETSLIDLGIVRYSVAPVYGQWVGPASAWSLPVS